MTGVTAEPVAGSAVSLTLTAQVSNGGNDALPAGLPLTFYARGKPSERLRPPRAWRPAGSVQSGAELGAPTTGGDWDIVVVPNGGQSTLGDAVLCEIPAEVRVNIGVTDVPLVSVWNLVSVPVQPDNPDVATVQRPISGTYTAILGYNGGLQQYGLATTTLPGLATVEAGRGYWIRETLVPLPDEEEPWQMRRSLRCASSASTCPRVNPVPLAAGWNLTGYLPVASLPVTEALSGVQGAYGAVLGFDGTAASYYPNLEAGTNTLAELAPSAGFSISATQAITLQYPLTAGLGDHADGAAHRHPVACGTSGPDPAGRAGSGRPSELHLGEPVWPGLPARRQARPHRSARP